MSNPFVRLAGTTTSFVQDRFNGRKDRGATMVEYGLLVGLISIAAVTLLVAVGPQLETLFTNVVAGLTQANA